MRIRVLWAALKLVLIFTAVVGLGYNFAMVGLGEAAFHHQANGSLVKVDGRVVGSRLIGQDFTAARFFHGRPSATSPKPYNAASSASSNLGPTNPKLLEHIKKRIAAIEKENPGVKPSQIPPGLVESSGSGLDPDISPAAAYLQAPRVARANHLPVTKVRALIRQHTSGRFAGIYGAPHVNVLELNIAVLKAAGR
ncbi:MAG TPA: potassium-transporting ATPase subunit KdpC [Streptosporangiaceae bacterium]|nr:potassium-transporting ATPase subunit KdpC [Streptosporangiaceae bacterium]